MASNSNDKLREKVIGIWLRVSAEDQVRGESPEVHENSIALYTPEGYWTDPSSATSGSNLTLDARA